MARGSSDKALSSLARRLRCERGQASVELVGTLPFVICGALIAWQLVLVGHVAWMTAHAARAGARAAVVSRDAGRAVRSALPPPLRDGARVVRRAGGGVRVSVPVPVLLHRWASPVSISASADLGV